MSSKSQRSAPRFLIIIAITITYHHHMLLLMMMHKHVLGLLVKIKTHRAECQV